VLEDPDVATFEVLSALVIKSRVFWDTTPFNPLKFIRLQFVISQKIELLSSADVTNS
jgi:hypothetical protein